MRATAARSDRRARRRGACRRAAGRSRKRSAARRGRKGRRQRGGASRCCRSASTSTSPEPDGTTALHWAVRNDDLDARRPADSRRRQRQGREPLRRHADRSWPASTAAPPIVERLLEGRRERERDRPVRRNGAHDLRAHGQASRPRKVLLAHGARVDARESWRGQTALMWAAAQGHPRR